MRHFVAAMILVLACGNLMADVDFAGLGDNGWIQLQRTGNGPSQGGDVHWSMDTTGYTYMFGGCTYGNGAGGSHNNDVYRFNLKTGYVDKLSGCTNNTFTYGGGCQAGQTYDITRNCIWLTRGFSANTCVSGGRTGLMKFQCPDGPLTDVNAANNAGQYAGFFYYDYDPVNDLIYCPSSDFNGLSVYNCKTNAWKNGGYPTYKTGMADASVPCCVDRKRGLWVATLFGAYGGSDASTNVTDIWFYNGATGTWTVKTPVGPIPQFYQAELAYDDVNDKYVYFGGGCVPEVWAYDYTTNAWTKMDQGSRAYNDANPSTSTWPPNRGKHAWEYSPKYNVFASWGGGAYGAAACTDYDNNIAQPIWMYRYSRNGTAVDIKSMQSAPAQLISVSPNPANDVIQINLRAGKAGARVTGLALFDIAGKRMSSFRMETPVRASSGIMTITWKPENIPSGVYIVKGMMEGKQISAKVLYHP